MQRALFAELAENPHICFITSIVYNFWWKEIKFSLFSFIGKIFLLSLCLETLLLFKNVAFASRWTNFNEPGNRI